MLRPFEISFRTVLDIDARAEGRSTIQDYPETDLFKKQMRDSLQREIRNSRAIEIAKHANVCICGEQDEMVYFIESGQAKLLMLSSEGRECLLVIHDSGDVFRELCLSGITGRLETATAMEDTLLKKVPCAKFLERLATDSLLEGFASASLCRDFGIQPLELLLTPFVAECIVSLSSRAFS